MIALALTAINGVVLLLWFRREKQAAWFLGPTFFLVLGFLNYAVRALVLNYFPERNVYGIDSRDAEFALAYYTGFALLVVAGHRAASGAEPARAAKPTAAAGDWISLWILTVLYLGGNAYQLASGRGVYGLYESMGDLERSAPENIAASLVSLKWLVISWAAFGAAQGRAFRFWAPLVLSVALVVVRAVISTAKADILMLLFLYLATKAFQAKRPSRVVIGAAIAFGIAFSAYSYIARGYGTVRGDFSLAGFVETVTQVQSRANDGVGDSLGRTVDRFSYLDGLALALDTEVEADSPFVAGSIVEVAMLVPRAVWPNRPHISFNHYATSAVWRQAVFAEMPIGRVGEAALVLGSLGVLVGLAYGFIWSRVARRGLRSRSLFGFAFYFWLLFQWIIPDAYLTYGVKTIVYLAPVVLGSLALGRLFGRASLRREGNYRAL